MRAFTLIELMISIALMSIITGLSTTLMLENRAIAAELVLRERALQALELEADALVRGAAADEKARARLATELPGAHLSQTREGPFTRLRISWTGPRGRPAAAELAVVAR